MAASVLIRKQKIRLRTTGEPAALALRKVVNDTLQPQLAAMMERVFERNAPAGLYVNMDKISIDLGQMSAGEFEREFIKLAETKLTAELGRQLQEYMDMPHRTANVPDSYASAEDNPASLKLTPVHQQEINAYLYYLQHGIYPWWYAAAEKKTPGQLAAEFAVAYTETILLKLIGIARTHSSAVVLRIVRRLFGTWPALQQAALLRSFAALYNQSGLPENTEIVLAGAAQLAAVFSVPMQRFYQYLFSFIIQHQPEAGHFMSGFFKKIMYEEKLSISQIQASVEAQNPGDQFTRIIAGLGIQPDEPPATEHSPPADDAAQPEGSSELPEPEGIFVSNAGLVLLHPFLQYLFTDCDLLGEKNQFKSAAAQHRAAVLLYYLQAPGEGYNEWEMALNKILCGMDCEEVLPGDIILSNSEKQNCNTLLQAVIQHWEALKGAGIDALRSTFLLREGKLSRKDSYWLLQAERTGTDILLDKLPWGYGTIKLPWLGQMIHVEW